VQHTTTTHTYLDGVDPRLIQRTMIRFRIGEKTERKSSLPLSLPLPLPLSLSLSLPLSLLRLGEAGRSSKETGAWNWKTSPVLEGRLDAVQLTRLPPEQKEEED
jgi:hypothetical protein